MELSFEAVERITVCFWNTQGSLIYLAGHQPGLHMQAPRMNICGGAFIENTGTG